MPERAAVTQAVQIGLETTPGTPVAANKLLASIGLSPGVQVDMQSFRPQGQKFNSIIVPGREWVACSISGVGSYTELDYLFSCLLQDKTAGVQEGATTAYRRSYVPAPRAEDTVKTLTVEQGGAVRAHRTAYVLPTEVALTFARAGIEVSGSCIGQRLEDGIVLTAAPTGIEEKPIIANEVDVFMDATAAGIGGTKLLRVLRATWRMGDRFNPVWPLNSALDSYGSHVEAVPSSQITLLVEADAVGMGILANMRQGASRFLRIQATSPDEAGVGFPYQLRIDGAGKVSAVSEFSDEDGVYAIQYTFDLVYDSTLAKAFSIDTWNKQASLA